MMRSVFRVSIHPKLPVLARQNVQSPLSETKSTCSPIWRLSTERALTAGPYFKSDAESMTKARLVSFDPGPNQIETLKLQTKNSAAAMQSRRQNKTERSPGLSQAGKIEKAAIQKVSAASKGK